MQCKALKFFQGGSEHPLDPSAPFEYANACFPNWGLMAPIVIFWLTPCYDLVGFELGTFQFYHNAVAHRMEL